MVSRNCIIELLWRLFYVQVYTSLMRPRKLVQIGFLPSSGRFNQLRNALESCANGSARLSVLLQYESALTLTLGSHPLSEEVGRTQNIHGNS